MISEVLNIDCMNFMATCKDKQFDLAICDPPYGRYSEENKIIRTGGTWSKKYQQDNNIDFWDFAPDQNYFNELMRISKNQIIWGGNYFTENLKNNRCFIIWQKETISETFSMAMCEYAWCSFNENSKLFLYRPQANDRIHPTQKPVQLYKWLLKNYAKPGDTILDTHLGSGSSRIACYEGGFDFWGCELDLDYFNAGNKRFENYKLQLKLNFAETILK